MMDKLWVRWIRPIQKPLFSVDIATWILHENRPMTCRVFINQGYRLYWRGDHDFNDSVANNYSGSPDSSIVRRKCMLSLLRWQAVSLYCWHIKSKYCHNTPLSWYLFEKKGKIRENAGKRHPRVCAATFPGFLRTDSLRIMLRPGALGAALEGCEILFFQPLNFTTCCFPFWFNSWTSFCIKSCILIFICFISSWHSLHLIFKNNQELSRTKHDSKHED